MDDKRLSNVPANMMRVGYWMTEKKLRRLNFCAFETLCRLVGNIELSRTHHISYFHSASFWLTNARSACCTMLQVKLIGSLGT